jgi:hypothetical protein
MSNSEEYLHYILIGFNEQRIGCLFTFLYDENSKCWKFGSIMAFTNTLDGI